MGKSRVVICVLRNSSVVSDEQLHTSVTLKCKGARAIFLRTMIHKPTMIKVEIIATEDSIIIIEISSFSSLKLWNFFHHIPNRFSG